MNYWKVPRNNSLDQGGAYDSKISQPLAYADSICPPPEIGAPQIRLRSVVSELRQRGNEVEVLTAMLYYPTGKIFPGYSGRWRMRDEIDGVPVRRTWIYAGTGKAAHIRLANYFSFTLTALIAALFGPRPDVMFVESQPLSWGLVAILMKWLRGVPYISRCLDLQVDVAGQLGFMRNRSLLRWAFVLENFFLRLILESFYGHPLFYCTLSQPRYTSRADHIPT